MNQYPLTESELSQYEQITGRIRDFGGLFRCDQYGQILSDHTGAPDPLDYEILNSRRYLVDSSGTLWTFFPEGSSKDPSRPHGGGAPWRNNRVEMWNGRWRKVNQPDGSYIWKKVLIAAPLDKRINGHPGMTQIEWYKNVKGYRHPLDGPSQPDFDTSAGTSEIHQDRSDGNDAGSQHSGPDSRRAYSAAETESENIGNTSTGNKKTARTNRRKS